MSKKVWRFEDEDHNIILEIKAESDGYSSFKIIGCDHVVQTSFYEAEDANKFSKKLRKILKQFEDYTFDEDSKVKI